MVLAVVVVLHCSDNEVFVVATSLLIISKHTLITDYIPSSSPSSNSSHHHPNFFLNTAN